MRSDNVIQSMSLQDALNFCVQYNTQKMQSIKTSKEEDMAYLEILKSYKITPSMIEQEIKKHNNKKKTIIKNKVSDKIEIIKDQKELSKIDLSPFFEQSQELNTLLDNYINKFSYREDCKQIEFDIASKFKLTKPQICQAICYRLDQTNGIGASYYKHEICTMYHQNIDAIEKNSKIISQKRFDLKSAEDKVKELKIQCKNYYKRKIWNAFEKTCQQLQEQSPSLSRKELIEFCEKKTKNK